MFSSRKDTNDYSATAFAPATKQSLLLEENPMRRLVRGIMYLTQGTSETSYFLKNILQEFK